MLLTHLFNSGTGQKKNVPQQSRETSLKTVQCENFIFKNDTPTTSENCSISIKHIMESYYHPSWKPRIHESAVIWGLEY